MRTRNAARPGPVAIVSGCLGAAVMLAMAPQLAAEPPSQGAIKPNILLIFSDQQHWQALGCMDPFFDTPHLDALAADSTLFERSFCTTPQCSPSRSSLLTGFYPSTTGVLGNVRAAGGKPLARPTLAPSLQAAGYTTGYFGKWHLGDQDIATAGWDRRDFTTNDSRAEKNAVAFLKEMGKADTPFVLFVSLHNPHDVYYFARHEATAPLDRIPLPESWARETFAGKPPIQKRFMEADQGKVIHNQPRARWQQYRDCYRAKTKLLDDNTGVILDELKRQGLWDSTIVLFTSDHGDMDTQHKLIFKGPFMYEHMMRVPLLIRVPERFGGQAPRRLKDIDVVNVDIAPTIRALCGLAEAPCDGRSLKPLLTGAGAYQPRPFVIGQYYSKQRWVNPIRMIRTADFKLNRHIRYGDELYDLKNDPHELRNLAEDEDYNKIKRELSELLDQWVRDHDDPFYTLKATDRSGQVLD